MARAGKLTRSVATNMAGRGTDIMLGGNRISPPRAEERGLSPSRLEEYEKAGRRLERAEEVGPSTRRWLSSAAVRAGHQTPRVGRSTASCGRSGARATPAIRFYLSLGDDLMRLFNERVQ